MTDDINTYSEERHPKEVKVEACYICDKPLVDPIDSDHIIPDHFFQSTDGYRPQLNVHYDCDNKKSRDDKFAMLQLQTLCSLDKDAEKALLEFLHKAEAEKPNAHLIGKEDKVRNLRLALTLFEKTRPSLDIVHKGEVLTSFHIPKKNGQRLNDYINQLCRGLYIRNVPGSWPTLPTKLSWIPYEHAKIRGNYDSTMQHIRNIINTSSNSRFSQVWPTVLYSGSRVAEDINKGYIFVEFYGSVGILALFGDVPNTIKTTPKT